MTTPRLIPGLPGDKLVAPLNAPAAGNAAPGVQPGVTSGIVLAQYVVVFGTSGGVFIYSGTPAHGNPPLYWMGNVTADPYRNAVNPGIWAGQSSGPQVGIQINGGAGEILFQFPGTFAGDARIGATGSGAGAAVELIGPQDVAPNNDVVFLALEDSNAGSGSATWFMVYQDANGGLNTHVEGTYAGVQLPVVASMSAVKPGTGTSPTNPAAVEGWHPMTPLLNSWAAQAAPNVQPQYRKVASPPNSVEIIGSLSAAAATAITFYQLPASYRPASQQPFPVGTFSGSAALDNVTFGFCDTSGNLTVQQRTASATGIYFHGFISLDA